jgi:hydrogenase expression/formation protein HypE
MRPNQVWSILRQGVCFGKVDQNFLRNVIFKNLGVKRSDVLVGPGFGVDNAVVQMGKERVLVATTDPLSYIPSLGPEASAWLSVHLLASDLTTSGLSPEFGLFDFNLPPTLNETNFAKYWKSFHNEFKKLRVSIIGGHTGRYPGLDYTIVGGGVLIATGPADRYLTSSMASDGDDVILTKGAAIETTGVLARIFPHKVKKALGARLFDKALTYLHKVSTVEDALTAASLGVRRSGVTAMHDATEGGVVAGMIELTTASKLGLAVDLDEILVSEETRRLCELFQIDPMVSLSEGSLIVVSRPTKTDKIVAELSSHGIPSRIVGRLTSKFRGCKGITSKGMHPLRYPTVDPYWKAYSKAVAREWS